MKNVRIYEIDSDSPEVVRKAFQCFHFVPPKKEAIPWTLKPTEKTETVIRPGRIEFVGIYDHTLLKSWVCDATPLRIESFDDDDDEPTLIDNVILELPSEGTSFAFDLFPHDPNKDRRAWDVKYNELLADYHQLNRDYEEVLKELNEANELLKWKAEHHPSK